MARADYEEQLRRHAGQWDVLPFGLPVPSLAWASDSSGRCGGTLDLTEAVLEGNRWPAVSGALLAECACRCATLAMLMRSADPAIRQIAVRFRRAIRVAEPRTRPHVADGVSEVRWTAAVDDASPATTVGIELSRQLPGAAAPVVAVQARAQFDAADATAATVQADRRIADYLATLPQRLALPAYELGWSDTEIRGVCREMPGSLLGAAEEALGDAGKIARGLGVPDDHDESMLLAEMTYRWVRPVQDGRATYVARTGERRRDEKGRTWLGVTADLDLDGERVGEAEGSVVFQTVPRRS
ncbi:MAG TPA: hypothetical protein VEC57_07930 [Candidatus Limnocylindrales bacterium]|nr:hypothetical protein [Candidatus Limnocylindrales bacterium]